MYRVKIVIVGSPKSGKTYITNLLSEAVENVSGDYHPTKGVRIVEYECDQLNVNGKLARAEVELWDTSGDQKYESCWPAIQRDTHGVILLYDPAFEEQARHLDILYSHFVTQQGLKEQQCIIFSNKKPGGSQASLKLSSMLSRVPQIDLDLSSQPTALKTEIQRFLSEVLKVASQKRDQDEMLLIK
ncbi:unnamed protein product [Darwinula stevensoni]|uniref:Intraflagellar transport protein 22 homolog n=1 Tax=Darwinula stevensoni TaxID=69355 RepID=A0A7R9A430_9CRUS|nr:unnamed protein product [Darwinula stevensoni]CAG0891746.1 unnamed protein product [Darwinula stevensoni]